MTKWVAERMRSIARPAPRHHRRSLGWGVSVAFSLALLVVQPGRISAQEPLPPLPPLPPLGAETGAAAPATPPANDPPARVARVSVLNGDVSAEPAGVDTFSAAELNQVLTSGDRVYTDADSTAELEAGGIAVRLGGGTDLTVSAMTDTLAQLGLAAGSVHLRSYALDPGTVLELDSPEAAITVLQPGDVRVDVDTAAHTTTVSLDSGQVQVDGPGTSQVLTPGQHLRLHGGDPAAGQTAYAEPLAPAAPDSLDGFSDNRDSQYASGADAESPYLSTDTVGGADLAGAGSWDSSDFGPVWYPAVAVGWQPYCFGHWRWVAPWGWTWVGVEPWGFAPFHYGRWAHFGDGIGGRWGWIPGPRGVRPVYAPALVAFAGGTEFSHALGYAPGLGITAWFPLGPREPYAPPYHGSTLYVNRVNAGNLYNTNSAEVRGLYNQRAVNVFATGPLANRGYANRGVGTVAVLDNSFAAGHSVGNARLNIPAETLAGAAVMPHPALAPERAMLSPHPAKILPPVLARPLLTDRAVTDRASPNEVPGGIAGTVLVHRAEPPPSRPSFEQQRQAMQAAEPGRPLSPAQMDRLRDNRPSAPGPAHGPASRAAGGLPAPGAPPPPHGAPPPAGGDHHH